VWSPLDTYTTTPHPWLQVDFPSATVKRIVLWFGQDSGNANVGQVLAWEQEPNRCTRGADRLPTDFSVDYWNGSAWVTLTETVTTGNVYVMREYELATGVTTTKLRLNITAGQGVRPLVAEFEAFTEDPVIGTSYFADGPITADAPDGKPFRRVIAQLPTIARSIDRNALGGAISTSIGTHAPEQHRRPAERAARCRDRRATVPHPDRRRVVGLCRLSARCASRA
jgi:hypothetical protein